MSNTTQEVLPIVIEALVKSAERLEHVTVDTDTIIKALTNGLSSAQKEMRDELIELRRVLVEDILPKLNYEEILQHLEVERIASKKEMYKIKMAFWTKIFGWLIGSGGLIIVVLKWVILPLMTGVPVPIP